jgi:nucleoside-diphosphate-sugar epimerase
MAYKSEGFVDVRIARIFNTFGPRMHPDDGRVVSNFIKQVWRAVSDASLHSVCFCVWGVHPHFHFSFPICVAPGCVAVA